MEFIEQLFVLSEQNNINKLLNPFIFRTKPTKIYSKEKITQKIKIGWLHLISNGGISNVRNK
jgi:hypothetical protein